MNKQVIKYAIYGAIIIIFCVILVRSCTISDRYSRLQGEYTALRGIATENARIAEDKIDKANETIIELDRANAQLIKHVKLTELELSNLDGDVVQLEGELVTIRHQVETIPNLRAQVVNLEGQVNTWKVKFTLAEKIISDKDSIIFNLKQQYGLQLGVSAEYKALYENQQHLVEKCNTLLGITQRKLRTAKVGGAVKIIAVGVLGGIVAYKLIK